MTNEQAIAYLQGIALTASILQTLVSGMDRREKESLREMDTDLTDLLDWLDENPEVE